MHIFFNAPLNAALRRFSPAILFSRFYSVWTPRLMYSRKRIHFDLRFTISIMFGHALTGSENRRLKQDFAFVVLKPTHGPGFFSPAPKPARVAKKSVLFAHSTSSPPRVLASQDIDHDKTWKAYGPLREESSPYTYRCSVPGAARRSSLGRESLTHFCMKFFSDRK